MKPGLEAVKRAKKILLIPAANLNLDCIFATVAFGLLLSSKGKKVGFGNISDFLYFKFFREKLGKDTWKMLQKDAASDYVITIPREKLQIHAVDWAESGENLEININGEGGQIEPQDLKIEKVAVEFDLIFIIGVNHPKQLGKFFEKNYQVFDPEKTVLVSRRGVGEEFEKLALVVSNNSFSQDVYGFTKELDWTPPKPALDLILAGLDWTTNGFREKVDPQVFKLAAEIMEIGGNRENARKLTWQNLSMSEISLLSEIYKNFTAAQDGIYYTIIDKPHLQNTKFLLRNLLPMADFYNCRVAFTIIKSATTHTIHIRSNSSKIDLRTLVKKYQGKGNRREMTFESQQKPQNIVQELLQEFVGDKPAEQSKVISPITPVPTPPAPQEPQTSSMQVSPLQPNFVQPQTVDPIQTPNPLAPAVNPPQALNLNPGNPQTMQAPTSTPGPLPSAPAVVM